MRARVFLWTSDGVYLESYTLPLDKAADSARQDVEAQGGYATVAAIDGSVVFRVPERDSSCGAKVVGGAGR